MPTKICNAHSELSTSSMDSLACAAHGKANLSNLEAADFISVTPTDLAKSRCTGELSGLKPPAFIRIGRRVRYRLVDLIHWNNSLSSYTSLAEQFASESSDGEVK